MNWLKKRLRREPSKALEAQLFDLVGEAAKASFEPIADWIGEGEIDGRPKRLVAFGELLAFFVHWAARTAHAKGLDKEFMDASTETLSSLALYLNVKILLDPPQIDYESLNYFASLVQEREFDYSKVGHEFVPARVTEEDRGAELMAAFSQALWFKVARTLTFDGMIDDDVHANFVRAIVARMYSGFTSLGER